MKDIWWKMSSIRKRAWRCVGVTVLACSLWTWVPSISFAVGKDTSGPDVFVIQGMLKSLGSYSGEINGYFNDATVQGVKYFQEKHGLPVTGSVDDRTLESITYAYSKMKNLPQTP